MPTKKVAEATFFMGGAKCLHPVHQDVQEQPHHIDKVPVPSRAFETEVAFRAEVAVLQTQSNKQQHQHAEEYVETVEACEQEEGRAINAR